MEVVRRLWRERIAPVWHAFTCAIGDFLEVAAFRVVLAFDVIVGRLPRQVEKRWWNRAVETPVLVDVFDWTEERRIFSVLVWPSLESSEHDAAYVYRQRVDKVKEAVARGAADMAWSTRFETDYGLKWDHERQVWTASDGFAYDGKRMQDAA